MEIILDYLHFLLIKFVAFNRVLNKRKIKYILFF